ncbi:PD-(D/E)XK nuclease family protein [Prevotella sp.]|uniref:PD-(D/E)XK nuclease family protein n=1 Tax=uncultured Prevotella sp. TaxID=159272 RepID=UPI0027E2C650|nr:PD-(D/E)XK nuclease family protein [uncultured Prevotella sp.]
MKTFVEKLKNNPIFQLSLSSKELFHSNFLAWLAEGDNTRCVFNKVMQTWLDDKNWEYKPNEMEVKREYNHFDFCVCDKLSIDGNDVTGSVQVVLENKFKSIAYKAQLVDYKDRTKTLNEEGYKNKYKAEEANKGNILPRGWRDEVEHPNTKYILLTLADNFLDKDEILSLGWKIVTYAEYAKLLRTIIGELKDDEIKGNKAFYVELIAQYCNFIEMFSEHINECLDNVKENNYWDILKNDDFTAVRCNDIWQKVVMHKYAQELFKLTQEKFPNTKIVFDDKDSWNDTSDRPLMIRVAYFRNEALVELKYLLNNGVVFCVQQQGDNGLSIGMVVKEEETIKKSVRKQDKGKWNASIKKLVAQKKLDRIITGDIFNSFQSEGSCGYYYIHNSEKLNIGDTLKLMVELMNKAKAI